ncbi:hypothetical protein LAB1_25170 [Roseibium sp. LAB1]
MFCMERSAIDPVLRIPRKDPPIAPDNQGPGPSRSPETARETGLSVSMGGECCRISGGSTGSG